MRALVTGGAGFIGSHLSERLAGLGYSTLVVDDLSSGVARLEVLEQAGCDLERLDITDARVERVIGDFRPDVIFHLAAQIDIRRSVADPVLDAETNVVGTLRILQAATGCGARVVNASSGGATYGDLEVGAPAFTEDSPLRPSSPYGISKKVVEDYLRVYRDLHGLAFVSLALGNIYGPRQDPSGEAGVVAIFASKLLAGERCVIFGDGKATRDYVFVEDVVDAFVASSSRGDGETFNVGSGTPTSVDDLYSSLAAIVGAEAEPEYVEPRPGELQRTCLDSSKAARILGWTPRVTLQDGLRQTVDFLRGSA